MSRSERHVEYGRPPSRNFEHILTLPCDHFAGSCAEFEERETLKMTLHMQIRV